jgi:tetratricopeptide (TPR) repeat protein
MFQGCTDNLENENIVDPFTLSQINELHIEAKENINNTEKAYGYANEMLSLAAKINAQKQIGDAYNILGALNRSENNYVNDITKYDNAIRFYKKSLTAKTWLKDREGMAITNRNIAFVYQLMKDYEKAKDSYWTSLYTWKKLGDKNRMAQLYNDLGIIYELILESKGAANYDVEKNIIYNLHLNALELNKISKNQKGMGWVYNNIATSYMEKKDYVKALYYLDQSIDLKSKVADEEGLATAYNNYGVIYLNHFNNIQKALFYFKKAEEYGERAELLKTYESIASVLEKKGDFGSAIQYLKKLDKIKEDLRSSRYKEELAQIEAKYSVEYAGL